MDDGALRQLGRPVESAYVARAQEHTHRIAHLITSSDSLRSRTVDVFLQGSFATGTCTSPSSDIDIVAQTEAVLEVAVSSKFPADSVGLLEGAGDDLQYSWSQYRTDLLSVLSQAYPNRVQDENNSIRIQANQSANLPHVDIVPAATYRKYNAKLERSDGICFWRQDDAKMIVNYPKQHKLQIESKSSKKRSGEQFRRLVRCLKRLRDSIDGGSGEFERIAASFWIEGLVFNLPDKLLTGIEAADLSAQFDYLLARIDEAPARLWQPSGHKQLFSSQAWKPELANRFIHEVQGYIR